MNPLVAIPIKPFGVAKARLSPVLDATQRSLLGKAIAAHTVETARKAGARVAVVTADRGVAELAASLEAEVIWESDGLGLNGAATLAVARAEELNAPWAILHADLPLITPVDLEVAFERLEPDGYVLSPSYDGGTSLIMGHGPFTFSYGPGSYHRHLAAAGPRVAVVVRTGLTLDLDTPQDLSAIQRTGLTTSWHGIPG